MENIYFFFKNNFFFFLRFLQNIVKLSLKFHYLFFKVRVYFLKFSNKNFVKFYFILFIFLYYFNFLNFNLKIFNFSKNKYSFIKNFYFKNIFFKNFYFKNIFFKNIFLKNIFFLFLFIFILFFLIFLKKFSINKIFFIWFILFYIIYLILSGFIFFIKKYQFSKFTSVIQRFWRRTFIIFWLVESFLFFIFLYLTINSNSEPFFCFDNIQFFKTHLTNLRYFFFKSVCFYYFYIINFIFLLNIRFLSFRKLQIRLLIITCSLIYFIWVEFYQFFYVISYYFNVNWVFEFYEKHWFLENELKKTRISNHYVNLCIILKFWHIIFIMFFWLFFLFNIKKLNRVRYPLFSTNLQNFLILYIMSWVTIFPWLKYVLHKFLEVPYYWFFSNYFFIFFRLFFSELNLFYINIFFNFSSYLAYPLYFVNINFLLF